MNTLPDKKRALGKGLNQLGLSELLGSNYSPLNVEAAPASELRHLPIHAICPGRSQPRKEMDPESLEALAHSIRAQGVIQPIVVRRLGSATSESYEIIAGERRWRAAQLAGLDKIPALLRDISDEACMAMALIENIQREDLNAIEEANMLSRLIQEFQMTHQQIADLTGKSRPSISNILRLLNLEEEVKALLIKGLLEMGHARALLPLSREEQVKMAALIVEKALSVRAAEALVNKRQNPAPLAAKSPAPAHPSITQMQNLLKTKLSAPVSIQHSQKGHGKLTINYKTLTELEKIVEQLI